MHTVTGSTNVMHRMGAQVHGLGANEPTCTPLVTPLGMREREVICRHPYQGASGLSIDCRTLTLDIALPASEKEQISIYKVK